MLIFHGSSYKIKNKILMIEQKVVRFNFKAKEYILLDQ